MPAVSLLDNLMSAGRWTNGRVVMAMFCAAFLGGGIAAVIVAGTAKTSWVSEPSIDVSNPPHFADIAQAVGRAVVNIQVNSPGRAPLPRAHGDDAGVPDIGQPIDRSHGNTLVGQGSGFIVRANGLILTNAHVVRGAHSVVVKLADRREFVANVLGSDDRTDVAVLKIDAHDLPVVISGDPGRTRVGDWVLAIGSPYGFQSSVSVGVVSAKERSLPEEVFVPFIQTDVAINPGNSGGPLLNRFGQVVGINSQIFSLTGGYQGLSFAIPIDLASKVADQIIATGHATHARLGVTVEEVNQSIADAFNADRPEGALVSAVERGGPADQAGLQPGDIVRTANGQKIVASAELPAIVGRASPGERLELEVWRAGSTHALSPTLGLAASRQPNVAPRPTPTARTSISQFLRPPRPAAAPALSQSAVSATAQMKILTSRLA